MGKTDHAAKQEEIDHEQKEQGKKRIPPGFLVMKENVHSLTDIRHSSDVIRNHFLSDQIKMQPMPEIYYVFQKKQSGVSAAIDGLDGQDGQNENEMARRKKTMAHQISRVMAGLPCISRSRIDFRGTPYQSVSIRKRSSR